MQAKRYNGKILIWIAALFLSAACNPVSFQKTDEKGNPVGPASCHELNNCPPRNVTQNVNIQSLGKVDVLFVVDNSASMEPEQAKMADKFPDFIQSLGGVDWQLAITTTDMSGDAPLKGGNLVEFRNLPGTYVINRQFSGVEQLFRETVQVNVNVSNGEVGDGDERGIYAALKAVEKNQFGFVRPDADLAVVILSDEDERSYGGREFGFPTESGRDYPVNLIDKVKEKFGQKKFSAHSIIVKTGDTACKNEQSQQLIPGLLNGQWVASRGHGQEGRYYEKLTSMTGGVAGSICDATYSQTLQVIGRVINQNRDSATLECVPQGAVEVTFNPPQSISVSQTGNKIYFSPVPSHDTTIQMKYNCTN